MTATQQRATSGTLGGAAGGAVIGAIAGNAGLGTAIDAGAGRAGGPVYDKAKKDEQAAYQQAMPRASPATDTLVRAQRGGRPNSDRPISGISA